MHHNHKERPRGLEFPRSSKWRLPQENGLLGSIILLPFLLLTTTSAEAATSSNHKNVLLIVVDDLRPSLGCYGDSLAITPNIDLLSSISIKVKAWQKLTMTNHDAFTLLIVAFKMNKAYTQCALCGPSRASFLSSRYPDHLRILGNHRGVNWRDNNVTKQVFSLPQFFKKHGYATKSIGKVFHPFSRGNPEKEDDREFSWTETPYHPSSLVCI